MVVHFDSLGITAPAKNTLYRSFGKCASIEAVIEQHLRPFMNEAFEKLNIPDYIGKPHLEWLEADLLHGPNVVRRLGKAYISEFSSAENEPALIAWNWYLQRTPNVLHTFFHGHEETHVLDGLELLPLLEAKMKANGVPVSFTDRYKSGKEDREVRAHLGGLFAAQQNGEDLQNIAAAAMDYDHFQTAWRIYQRAHNP